ncbi:MAG: DUF2339 domain-containing protein [Nitrospirae bacterium YQR-1]
MLKCPGCSREIYRPGNFCVSCGMAFTGDALKKISFYFELTTDLSHLSKTVDIVQQDISSINTKLAAYEEIFNSEVKHLLDTKPTETVEASEKPQPDIPPQKPDVTPPPVKQPEPATDKRTKSSALEIRLGQKLPLIIGVVAIVLGVAYFIKYSFDRGWIGPAGRVAVAYLAGLLLMGVGDTFRKKQLENFGLSLFGGGIAILYFSTYSGFQLYHLFGAQVAFTLMVITTAVACMMAIVYDSKWLAVLGLIGGFLTPVLISTGSDQQIALMTYMVILNIGLLAVAFYKKWDILNNLGFFFTYMLFSAWFFKNYVPGKFWPTIIYLTIFYLIYSIAPIAYQFFKGDVGKNRGVVIIAPNSFIAFGFSYYAIKFYTSVEWVSVVTVFYSVVFLSLANFLYKRGKHERGAFDILISQSALFLVMTIPFLFSKHWTTIFWSAQAVALLWIGTRLKRKTLIYGSYVLCAVVAYFFLYYDYLLFFEYGTTRLTHGKSYTFMIIERYLKSFFVITSAYISSKIMAKDGNATVSSVFKALFGILLFAALNVEVSLFFNDYLPEAKAQAISVLWAIFSAVLMLKGFMIKSVIYRKTAFALFAVTILKVFLSDMSKMDVPYRIISFIFLGIILVVTSFLYYKYKDRIFEPASGEKAEKKDGKL